MATNVCGSNKFGSLREPTTEWALPSRVSRDSKPQAGRRARAETVHIVGPLDPNPCPSNMSRMSLLAVMVLIGGSVGQASAQFAAQIPEVGARLRIRGTMLPEEPVVLGHLAFSDHEVIVVSSARGTWSLPWDRVASIDLAAHGRRSIHVSAARGAVIGAVIGLISSAGALSGTFPETRRRNARIGAFLGAGLGVAYGRDRWTSVQLLPANR